MKIEYHNDKKGKYQSWTATATINGDFTNTNTITLEAYGPTQEQAKQELRKQIIQTITELNNLIEKL